MIYKNEEVLIDSMVYTPYVFNLEFSCIATIVYTNSYDNL